MPYRAIVVIDYVVADEMKLNAAAERIDTPDQDTPEFWVLANLTESLDSAMLEVGLEPREVTIANGGLVGDP